MNKFSVLLHIYYPDSYLYLIDKLSNYRDNDMHLLINICSDTPNKLQIIEAFKSRYPSTYFISTANIGKDVGGKLVLYGLSKYLKLDSEWLLLIHDKKSPQSINGERWREELFKIVNENYLERLLHLMEKKSVGIIGSREYLVTYSKNSPHILNDPNYTTLKQQTEQFKLNLSDFSFIGGTTFWIRKKVLDTFFEDKNPLILRNDLESGNVMDNFKARKTHAWERLFGLIASSQGYKVEGL